MTAAQLNFNGQRFSPEEWPEGVLSQMSQGVVAALFDVRNNLPAYAGLYPSPVARAHVRSEASTSRHSTLNGSRLSDATDFFVRKEHFHLVFREILRHRKIQGFGVYNNALYRGTREDYFMIHIDTRPHHEAMLWAADKEEGDFKYTYHSITAAPQKYFRLLGKMGEQI